MKLLSYIFAGILEIETKVRRWSWRFLCKLYFMWRCHCGNCKLYWSECWDNCSGAHRRIWFVWLWVFGEPHELSLNISTSIWFVSNSSLTPNVARSWWQRHPFRSWWCCQFDQSAARSPWSHLFARVCTWWLYHWLYCWNTSIFTHSCFFRRIASGWWWFWSMLKLQRLCYYIFFLKRCEPENENQRGKKSWVLDFLPSLW